ncbi:MAG TPA: hypothetical protein VGG72_08855 [Bryobacteraceae bacterium]|jgi:hypothetical protein
MKTLAAAACLGIIWGSLASGQPSPVKRIYVEAFPAKTGSAKLRDDLIEQLRKLGSIAIVASESDADAIVSGDGDMWIKGYRSLNPRSGRLPSDGEAVYAGFLSVELKDTKGDTLWSYLVTLGPASESISKDLSKQIVKHLGEALNTGALTTKTLK